VSSRAIDAIEHLGGMAIPGAARPYVGLWTRLQGFAPDEPSALIDARQVVRLHLMRNTVHLVSARDCLDWRTLFTPLDAAEFRAHFSPRRYGGSGPGHAARTCKAGAGGAAANRSELGKLLAERWPDADPSVLA
jgi:hypothetical protein